MNIKKADFFLPVMVLLAGSSYADDVQITPDIRLSERYEDNLTLQFSGNERATLVSTISPSLSLLYREEHQQLKANFRWNQQYYHEEPVFDFSEKLSNVKYNFNGERFLFDFNGDYLIQSSINTQLDESGSGNLQLRVPRTTRSASPSATYLFDEQNSLRLGYDYSDVTFERTPGARLNQSYSDYDNQQFSANFVHVFDERLKLNFLFAYSQFTSSGSLGTGFLFGIPFPAFQFNNEFSQKSDMTLYQAGAEYSFDESTKLSFSGGIRNTDTRSINTTHLISTDTIFGQPFVNSSSSIGHVFSANLVHNTEWGNINLRAAQQVNPATTGFQQQTTSFGGGITYNITERVSTSLMGSYLLSESVANFSSRGINDNLQANNRTFINISPSLRWRWSEDMNWDLMYTHRSQEFSSLNNTAYGNTLQLQFSYQPQINNQVK